MWAHVLAHNLVRTVMARAAAGRGLVPRSVGSTKALQILTAFRPLLEHCPPGAAAGGVRQNHDLLGAIATHRVADRPDRYEPRVKKRRRSHTSAGWLGVSPSLVYQWCAERRLPHLRLGRGGRRGKILIEEADIDAFLATASVESGAGAGNASTPRHIKQR